LLAPECAEVCDAAGGTSGLVAWLGLFATGGAGGAVEMPVLRETESRCRRGVFEKGGGFACALPASVSIQNSVVLGHGKMQYLAVVGQCLVWPLVVCQAPV
jgi:hypothetical protein